MNCKNCGNKFEGNFCNACGQSATVARINWKYLVNSVSESLLQINKGFLYTAKVLLLHPKKSLVDFFAGKRKRFSKPFAFLIVSATILLISTKIIGNETFVNDFIAGFKESTENRPKEKISLKSIDFFLENQTYLFLFTVPLFSIASFLSFRKSKYNFSEHLVLNLFITGEQLLIYALFSFISENTLLALLPLGIGFIYNLWVYNKLFSQINWLKRNLKLLVTYIIYSTLMMMLISILIMLQILRTVTT